MVKTMRKRKNHNKNRRKYAWHVRKHKVFWICWEQLLTDLLVVFVFYFSRQIEVHIGGVESNSSCESAIIRVESIIDLL